MRILTVERGFRKQPALCGFVALGGLILLALLVFSARSGPARAAAQGPDELYFAETGHVVREPFLSFYRNAENPDVLYGKPITEPFTSAQFGGAQVQYFERAVLALNPAANVPQALQVTAADLGSRLYSPGEEVPVPQGAPGCRVFPETDKQVCYDFLDFFATHGGAARLGFPISNLEIQDGLFVQYFQRARLEFRAGRSLGENVVVGDLGRRYFEGRENPRRLLPVEDGNLPQVILNLRTRAFVRQPVAGFEGGQAVYVLVQDQNGMPVEGARLSVSVRFPGQSWQALPGEALSGPNGVAVIPFTYGSEEPGMVEVRVLSRYEDLSDAAVTSFRIWY